ncbi:hypothetical protein BC374_18340 [Ensifer sp. LC13]|uniref:hypothetical protein n=1 Tax=unclassified Ensifer TaxID=2633371 RepID=UPI00081ECD18|nr:MULTISPECIES: hypothetical protein [unclassified Ensifer]OCO99484.1 hypothetical protein BC362_26795 [Ensifer sp. LC14]OCP10204.1 hypothetical protein BC374_18340 [Ensifer sp. LC13]OCP33161.1 hypothetical protein BC364_17440 [Ensifer sp. LC499]
MLTTKGCNKLSTYSLGGYAIALQARSKKTIVVEGKDDKTLFDRLRIDDKMSMMNTLVDTSDIIADETVSGLGAKAKIDKFLDTIGVTHGAYGRFYAFLDREWEGLLDGNQETTEWSLPQENNVRFVSIGHSIENYSFSSDCVIAYLKHFGSEVGTEEVFDKIRGQMGDILSLCAAFSEVARRRSIITRCDSIVRLDDVILKGDSFELSTNLMAQLSARGIGDGSSFIADVNICKSTKWKTPKMRKKVEFLAHGHIGENLMWVCCAKLLEISGVERKKCEDVAFGRKDERRRFWYSWLTNTHPESRSPIDKVLELAGSV